MVSNRLDTILAIVCLLSLGLWTCKNPNDGLSPDSPTEVIIGEDGSEIVVGGAVPTESLPQATEVRFPPGATWLQVLIDDCAELSEYIQTTPIGADKSNVRFAYDIEPSWNYKNNISLLPDGKLCVKDGHHMPSYRIKVYLEGQSEAKSTISVEPVYPSGTVDVADVMIELSDLSLYIGQQTDLPIVVVPSYATNKKINYSFAPAGVAEISADGVLRGLKQGTTVLTATSAADGSKKAVCNVIVYDSDVNSMQSPDWVPGKDKWSDKWDEDVKARANTAKSEKYLTAVEKQVYYYINLARLNPKLFAETYATDYYANDNFYKTLDESLRSMRAMPAFAPDRSMFDYAYCYALNGGNYFTSTSQLGHDRTGTGCQSTGFNSECVCWKGSQYTNGLDIVMQYLVDYGNPQFGHRKIMLGLTESTSSLKTMGVSIQNCKNIGGQFCVIDFHR